MKRVALGVVFLMAVAVSVCAEPTEPSTVENEYQQLDRLRAEITRARRELDRFMKDIAVPYADMDKTGGVFGQEVRVDVSQDANDVIVKADLPGMSKDKIEITLEKDRMLKISGSRDVFTKEESPGVVRQERMSGRFERLLELPAECESQGIRATYKEGVLEIVLPKKKGGKEEAVKVKVQ